MPGTEQEHVNAGCTSGDGKDTVFITLFYFSYPCTFGHAFQSLKCPIMFLGLLDETSCVRSDDLASISTAFLPTGVEASGHPDRMKSQFFVNLTNILGRPCWARLRGARQSGGGTQTTSFTLISLLNCILWGGETLRATQALFSPRVSLKPDT